jgi:hypothetical protein
VALFKLSQDPEYYFKKMIEESARRNYRKAEKNEYVFKRINYNGYLQDVSEIWRSREMRQGKMPQSLLSGEAKACSNPNTKTNTHDYPCFGILKGDQLVAYAGCFVAGEVTFIETIYGHGLYVGHGIMAMLIIDLVRYLSTNYPNVKYLAYGTYFGALPKMKRFKRKFGFMPYNVKWVLG